MHTGLSDSNPEPISLAQNRMSSIFPGICLTIGYIFCTYRDFKCERGQPAVTAALITVNRHNIYSRYRRPPRCKIGNYQDRFGTDLFQIGIVHRAFNFKRFRYFIPDYCVGKDPAGMFRHQVMKNRQESKTVMVHRTFKYQKGMSGK